jgi:8-oxo-dGTP diphosphatase
MIERDGLILAAQRPPGGWGAGKWEFPGGKLEMGEDPRAALVRECREELGVVIEPGEVFDVAAHSYADGLSVVLLFIRCRVFSGEPQPIEVADTRWVNANEILQLDWLEADWPIVEKWRASNSPRSH